MSSNIIIREYRDNDELQIVELLNEVFHGWPRLDVPVPPLEFWKWKYQDNPYKPNIITVSEEQGRIIGVNHSFGMRIKIGNHIVKSNYAADTAVSKEHQGKGISRDLIKLHLQIRDKERIKFTYFITRNPYLIKMNKKTYPVFPFTINNLVKIQDIGKQLTAMPIKNELLLKTGFQLLKLKNHISNSFQKSPPNTLTVTRIDEFKDDFIPFWNQVSKSNNFIVEKNPHYMNWRYCDPRTGKYIVETVKENEQLIGYSVLRINSANPHYPIGYIVDLIALPKRLDAIEALAINALNYFNENKVNIINYQIVNGHPYEKVMNKLGFIDSRIKAALFYVPTDIDENINILQNSTPDQIHFSYGALDTLPIGLS